MAKKAQDDADKEALKKALGTIDPNHIVDTKAAAVAVWFKGDEALFDDVAAYLAQLKEIPAERAPGSLARELASAVNNIRDLAVQIRNFISEAVNSASSPAQQRDALRTQFSDAYRQLVNTGSPLLSLVPANNTVDAALQAIEKAASDAQQRVGAIDQLLEAARAATQTVGVEKFAGVFSAEAEQHKKSAENWLIATIVLVAVTITAAVVTYQYSWSIDDRADAGRTLHVLTAKVAIFSILVTSIVATLRTYRSNRHNYVVNKHRENALTVFQAFVQGAGGDPATKSAVLLQATHCIFSPQPTGFMSSEPDPSPAPQIMEIVKTSANQK
jgi:hypothetical protein